MTSKTIKEMAINEYRCNRPTRAKLLNALAYIIREAENPNNEKVFFTTVDIGHGEMKDGVIIQDINALCGMSWELGSDFNPEYMLNGMQAVTQDADGYCMSVCTTNDLYSAKIHNLDELVCRIRQINR